jgi:hypothetical protein
MSLFKVWMILAADDSSRDFSFALVTSAHFSAPKIKIKKEQINKNYVLI